MKKIIKILLFVNLVFLCLSSIFWVKSALNFQAIYGGEAKISLTDGRNANLNQQEKIKIITKLTKKYDLNILRIIYRSDQDKDIYTNDLSLNGLIKNNQIDSVSADCYLSNKKNCDQKNIGNFRWLSNKETIRLFSLDGLKNLELTNEYYLKSKNNNKTDNIPIFLVELEQTSGIVGKQLRSPLSRKKIFRDLLVDPFFVVVLSFSLLLMTFCCLLFFLIQRSKQETLQILTGFSKFQQLVSVLNNFKRTLAIGFSSCLGFILIDFLLNKFSITLLFKVLALFVVTSLFLIFSLAVIILIWQTYLIHSKALHNFIKEKTLARPALVVSKIFTLLFLLTVPFNFKSIVENGKVLYHHHQADLVWEQAKNTYRTCLSNLPMTNTQEVNRVDQLYQKFFQHNYDQLVLISADNYGVIPSQGKRMYELNTKDKIEELTSLSGRAITVNATFLAWNQVKDQTGTVIKKNRFKFDEKTCNLLVPLKLKKYEAKIKANLINYYHEKQDDRHEQRYDPQFNLIYVKNNQKYFTYDQYTAENNNNVVIDPLVFVNNSLDPYQSCSSYFLFQPKSGTDPYQSIKPALEKEHLENYTTKVTAIYDERGKNIENNQRGLLALLIFAVILIIFLGFCIYNFNYSLFEKNKQRIRLKWLSGFSLTSIYCSEFLLWMLLDYCVFIPAVASFAPKYFVTLTAILTIFELLILWRVVKKRELN